jgi:type IV pilus assembly protein PilX
MNIPVRELPGPGRRQQGVVLVVSLLMLMVLTMIGLAATRSTTLEERMTANQNDSAVAFQAAEAALRDGEGQLSSASQPNYSGNTAGAYDATTMSSSIDWHTIDWKDTNKIKVYGGGITPTPANPPSYYIVKTSFVTPTQGSQSTDSPATQDYTYYIYAHGYGVTNAEVVLQSAFQE